MNPRVKEAHPKKERRELHDVGRTSTLKEKLTARIESKMDYSEPLKSIRTTD